MVKKAKLAQQSEDNLTIEYDPEDFKKSLPNLYEELKSGDHDENVRIPIDGVVHEEYEEEELYDEEDYEDGEFVPFQEEKPVNCIEVLPEELTNPGCVDFIRRCTTKEDAIEIIEYLFNRGEITEDEADEYRIQLEEKGLESFGPRKTAGYYERKYLRTTDFSGELQKSEQKKPTQSD